MSVHWKKPDKRPVQIDRVYPKKEEKPKEVPKKS